MFLHKLECQQAYGGPEEGGWWYIKEYPLWKIGIPLPFPESLRYAICRYFNRKERKRREKENKYGFTSVLSYRDTFYEYDLTSTPRFKPAPRPHYE